MSADGGVAASSGSVSVGRWGRLRQVARRLGPAGPLAFLSGVVPPLGGTLVIVMIPVIAPWLREHGVMGPPVAAVAGAVLGATMVLPMYSFMAVCGWSFGPVVGMATALSGVVMGAVMNYGWARWVCQDRVTGLIDEKPKWRAVYRELLVASPKRAFVLVTLIRIPPGFPFALTNFVMAAMRVPLRIMLPATALGSLPRTVVVCLAAAKMSSLSERAALDPWTLAGGIVVVVLSLVLIGRIAGRALAAATAGQGPTGASGNGDGAAAGVKSDGEVRGGAVGGVVATRGE